MIYVLSASVFSVADTLLNIVGGGGAREMLFQLKSIVYSYCCQVKYLCSSEKP